MIVYVIRRLLFVIPIVWGLSLAIFGLTTIIPGDPVELLIGATLDDDAMDSEREARMMQAYKRVAQENHYDEPNFYFSIIPSNYPDTLNRILPLKERQFSVQLLKEYGDWSVIQEFEQAVGAFQQKLKLVPHKDSTYSQMNALVNSLRQAIEPVALANIIGKLEKAKTIFSSQPAALERIRSSYTKLLNAPRIGLLRPKFIWHGFENRYHSWMENILHGDLGVSIVTHQSVVERILSSLSRTLWLTIPSVVLGLFIGLLLGVYLTTHDGVGSNLLSTAFFWWLSVPTFWIASLLVVFFTTSDYGAWTNIFPSSGIGRFPQGASWWTKANIRVSHLFLPVICMTMPIIAIISLQLKRSLGLELKKKYIQTALLKGLDVKRIIWYHGVKNAIFSVITMLGNLLPSLVSGSLVLEFVFNIPGMGLLLLQSIQMRDWAVVFSITLLVGVLTVINLLLVDIFYFWASPKVRFKNTPS